MIKRVMSGGKETFSALVACDRDQAQFGGHERPPEDTMDQHLARPGSSQHKGNSMWDGSKGRTECLGTWKEATGAGAGLPSPPAPGPSTLDFPREAIAKLAGQRPPLAGIFEQIRKAVVRRPSWREARKMHCHPFVIKKRDCGGWDLGGSDLFQLPRL